MIQNILVTGSTGVLGGYCVKYLLENTNLNITCLVRATSKEHGLQRQLHAINAYGAIKDPSLLSRLSILPGEITKEDFGLNPSELNSLYEQIDCVLHMAASVSFFSSDSELKQINVEATRHIVNFVNKAKKTKLIYTSSYSIHGKNKNSITFTEDDFDIGQSFENIPYPKSKYQAEKIIRTELDNRKDFMILRPGNIYGDSEHGRYPFYYTQGNDIFYNLIKTFVETGVAPKFNFHLDMTPVDYVSKVIAMILTTDQYWSQTFHLFNPNILPFPKLLRMLRHVGYKIKLVDIPEYNELNTNGQLTCHGIPYSSISTNLIHFYHHSFVQETKFHLSCDKTVSLLKKHHIKCPKIRHLLPVYYKYCVNVGYLNPPRLI